jgi:uncharacterized protein
MNPQINAILIGVDDIDRAKKFYSEGLGCPVGQDHKVFVQFNLGDGTTSLGLYRWSDLEKDAGVAGENTHQFRGFTLSYFVKNADAVDDLIGRAERAGGKVLKAATKQQWGGYSGTFADPDGYVWKVVANAA